MIQTLGSLKNLIKTKSYHIDYPLFRLHYQATVCLLLSFCLILTTKVLFGDTIDCLSRTQGHDKYHDNLCYTLGTQTTYNIHVDEIKIFHDNGTYRSTHQRIDTGYLSVLNPYQDTSSSDGINFNRDFRLVGRAMKGAGLPEPQKIKYTFSGVPLVPGDQDMWTASYSHRYYQYIPVILFLQALCFYLPHYVWKLWENSVVSSICKALHENRFMPLEYISSNRHLIDYLKTSFIVNRSLVYKYYLCHVFLLANLVAQIVVLDRVFNDQFITYGVDMLYYWFVDTDIYYMRGYNEDLEDIQDLNNPMNLVFPKMTQCQLHLNSHGGFKPERHQFMCVLPLNILHDKFFLMLWFWFAILICLTIIQVIYDIFYTMVPTVRAYMFKKRFGYRIPNSTLSESFLLDLIGVNSDRVAFQVLLKQLDIKQDNMETHSVV